MKQYANPHFFEMAGNKTFKNLNRWILGEVFKDFYYKRFIKKKIKLFLSVLDHVLEDIFRKHEK